MKKTYIYLILIFISSNAFTSPVDNTRWKIAEIADYDGIIGAYNTKETLSFLNQIIKYTSDSIFFDGQEYPVKKVTIEYWTSQNLYDETRGTASRGLTFKDIGLTGEQITTVREPLRILVNMITIFILLFDVIKLLFSTSN